jgi:hypothetical protein
MHNEIDLYKNQFRNKYRIQEIKPLNEDILCAFFNLFIYKILKIYDKKTKNIFKSII